MSARLAAELARAVAGPVRRPADPGFSAELAGFQLGLRHRPDVVVGALDAADVRAALRIAGDHAIPVTVHGTGHGMRSAADGGIVLGLRRLNEVEIDPVAGTARLGGGATWAEVIAATAPHGLLPPSGSAAGVGAAGYVFGGGLGLLARSDGWACDHVRSFTVATLDGTEREVGPDDTERFARLRGTGPVHGEVVTAMTVGLLPGGPLQGGGLTFDLGPATAGGDPAVLQAYREWTDALPDDLTSALRVMSFPDLDVLPLPLRGRRIARIAVASRGTAPAAERLVAPLRDAAPVIEDTLAPLRFTESARVHAEPADPGAYIGENLLLGRLDPAALDALAELSGPTMVIMNIRHLGAALARPPAVPDTVRGRDAHYLVSAVSPVDPRVSLADPAAAHAQASPVWALEPFAAARLGTSPAFTAGPRG
ncbi:FAD-linked oxidoreductase [Actinomadura craniellae]|uniref:FAD-linked oxidoreductase n=1 Tax=Actinomadura craniellae TaxID=2231787 RepID=A0A365H136_9ACTN|nr:FAD-dependent oxidoreductase [Actinomadura craniellae]RAY12746.1 FAD-linked oxidoreductase [Actinomadura craniellae]